MFKASLKRILVDACFFIAIFFSFYYLATTHFSFMLSLFHYRMFNLPAISYTLMRFVYILLPVFLLVPPLRTTKIRRIKVSLYFMGILYLIGNTWIFYFLRDNPMSAMSDYNLLEQYLRLNALNFDYLVWDTYDMYGILFSTIQAALYILLGYHIGRRRKHALLFYWLTVACSILFPVIYVYLISNIGEFSSQWLQKNTVLFAASIFMGVGLTIARTSRGIWDNVIFG